MHAFGCHHRHDRAKSPPLAKRLGEAETLCAEQGGRLTPPRRQVLAALIESGRALGAYDLIESVAARSGRRAAPITIYRALEFLTRVGLVHRIESRNAFLACPAGCGDHGHAVFMICDCCGAVTEAASPRLDALLGELAGANGFRPQGRVIEMAGRCAACDEAA